MRTTTYIHNASGAPADPRALFTDQGLPSVRWSGQGVKLQVGVDAAAGELKHLEINLAESSLVVWIVLLSGWPMAGVCAAVDRVRSRRRRRDGRRVVCGYPLPRAAMPAAGPAPAAGGA